MTESRLNAGASAESENAVSDVSLWPIRHARSALIHASCLQSRTSLLLPLNPTEWSAPRREVSIHLLVHRRAVGLLKARIMVLAGYAAATQCTRRKFVTAKIRLQDCRRAADYTAIGAVVPLGVHWGAGPNMKSRDASRNHCAEAARNACTGSTCLPPWRRRFGPAAITFRVPICECLIAAKGIATSGGTRRTPWAESRRTGCSIHRKSVCEGTESLVRWAKADGVALRKTVPTTR